MKKLFAVALIALASACATTNPYRYEEMSSCPNFMDDDQRASGVVRCRAMCSSEGRDYAAFADDCKCYCQPAMKSGNGNAPKAPKSTGPNNQI